MTFQRAGGRTALQPKATGVIMRPPRLKRSTLAGQRKAQTGQTMNDEPLVLAHSIEADVSLAFAWKFRTDIATWDDPPATFLLDGPFVEGSRGTTLVPGQEPLWWWIRDVQPGRSFAIEILLDRATLRFEWHLRVVSERRTKLTQRIILSGANAATYRQQVEAEFGTSLAAGMERIAASIVAAESAAGSDAS